MSWFVLYTNININVLNVKTSKYKKGLYIVKSKNISVINIYVNYSDFKVLRLKIKSPFGVTPKFNRVFNNPIEFLQNMFIKFRNINHLDEFGGIFLQSYLKPPGTTKKYVAVFVIVAVNKTLLAATYNSNFF